jgi:hypothetical protein
MALNWIYDYPQWKLHRAEGKEGEWLVTHPSAEDKHVDLRWRPAIDPILPHNKIPHRCLGGYDFAMFSCAEFAEFAAETYENPPDNIGSIQEQFAANGYANLKGEIPYLYERPTPSGSWWFWVHEPVLNENGYWIGPRVKLQFHPKNKNHWHNIGSIEVPDIRNELSDAPVRPSYIKDPVALDVYILLALPGRVSVEMVK